MTENPKQEHEIQHFLYEWEVENFMRISHAVAKIPGEPGMYEITGKNRQGKSSDLDALFYALDAASARKFIVDPVKKGERAARIKLEFTSGLVVERIVNDDLTYKLIVTMPNGKPGKQTDINKMLGFSLDPQAFLDLDSKKQLEYAMDAFGLKERFQELSQERKRLEEDRRWAGQQRDMYKGKAAQEPDEVKRVDPGVAIAERDELQKQVDSYSNKSNMIDSAINVMSQKESDIAELEQRLAILKNEKTNIENDIVKMQGELEEMPNPTTKLQKAKLKVDNLSTINEKAVAWEAYLEAKKQFDEFDGEWNQFNDDIIGIDQNIKALIKDNCTIDGLEIINGELYFQGHPLKQARDSSQEIEVCFEIAASTIPAGGIPLIRMRGGESLDSDMRVKLNERAQDHGVIVVIERMSEDDNQGIHIVDGSIVKNNYVESKADATVNS